jgi:hypothetical protein
MTAARRGLYEVVITEALASSLRQLDGRMAARDERLRAAEAADRIALHLGRVVERALRGVSDEDRVAVGVRLAQEIDVSCGCSSLR